MSILSGIAILSLISWIYLSLLHGRFWTTAIPPTPSWSPTEPDGWPRVRVVVPARNEAEVIADTVRAVLGQTYPGPLELIVVDDNSDDDTSIQAAEAAQKDLRLTVLAGQPLPRGWAGKVWAMKQGSELPSEMSPDFIWFTDADILHQPNTLEQLVKRAEGDQRDLVSRMALLKTDTIAEQFIIPAFVYFFQMLYPFRWSNSPSPFFAAAAGGCVLLRADRLARIGGVDAIRDALIDDCTLAREVKDSGGSLWLELTRETVSARGYGNFSGLWTMIARSAYTQLRHNPLILLGCVLGLGLTFLVPWAAIAIGLIFGQIGILAPGLLAWLAMIVTFWPMVRFYNNQKTARSFLIVFALPATALFYLMATIDSARRYHLGVGGQWKGRSQANCVSGATND
ncbi:MAG: glycosyltransferase [Verrucomicrobiota bacterium]